MVAILADGQIVDKATAGDEVALLVNQTPFYAESGGQVGDTGHASDDDGLAMAISDTQKRLSDLHVLYGKIDAGDLKTGAIVHQKVNGARRTAIRANHSATHLLHEALRRVLGPHVTQKGSLVNEAHLRFDFSHPTAMTEDDIDAVEGLVNDVIRRNDAVSTRLMTPDEAIEAGALALFGEKYGEEVRVLSMGVDAAEDDAQAYYSVELCGGTHVRRLGDIGLLKIAHEGAVASGVRRIEAYTGQSALAHIGEQQKLLRQATDILKIAQQDLPTRLTRLLDDRKKLESELAEAQKQVALAGNSASGGQEAVRAVNGISLMARCVDNLPAKQLRGLVDEGKKQIGSGIVVFVGLDNGKAGIAVGVTDDLTDAYDAVALVRVGAEKLGGKGGGGRADMAQAGGPDTSAGEAALQAVEAAIGAA